MDADGLDELIITFSGIYLMVFHYEDGMVFSHNFASRGMNIIRENGSYQASSSAFDTYYIAIRFSKDSYEERNLASVALSEEGGANYLIDEATVTEEEFSAFLLSQQAIPEPSWHAYPT